MRTDVLIVGAGPTGLMLANQLARRGVRPRIIDRNRGPAQQTRAMAVHARTLEIYAKLGIVERALDLGKRGAGMNAWVAGRRRARVPFGDVGRGLSPFPFVLMLGQDDNERIMGEHLRRQGVTIEWGTELEALTQTAEQATATLRRADGTTETVTASWVAGCDGGRSAVRDLNGIAFPGASYEHVFFVADTEATGSMTPGELNIYLWRRGFHLFFPMRGHDHWRVIGILPDGLADREDLTFDDLVEPIRREAGANLTFKNCSWFSTYKIHHRRTERFRKGRCFLLGDAAHVHSPMGGQGMNTGLQDAYNLAWKLALVLEGRAGDTLLDSYEVERKQVADTLLATTDRAFRLLVADNWLAGFFRTKVFARVAAIAMRRVRAQRLAFRTVSQIGIAYPQSPLSRSSGTVPSGAPQAGDRFPWLELELDARRPAMDLFAALDDTRFNLLVVGQRADDAVLEACGELVDVRVLPDTVHNRRELARAGVPPRAFYLLRPDGHVALAGTELDGATVARWLADMDITAPPRAMPRADLRRTG